MVKKLSDRTQRDKDGIRERLERNTWNPFERVDPVILEAIHKRNEQNKITHILETAEDALW